MPDQFEDWLDALGFARGGSILLLNPRKPSMERWQRRDRTYTRRVRAWSDPALGLPRSQDRKVLLALLELARLGEDLAEPDLGMARLSAAVRAQGESLRRTELLIALHRLSALRLHVTTFIRAPKILDATTRPPVTDWGALRDWGVWSASPTRWLLSEGVPTHGRAMWYALRLDPLFIEKGESEGAKWIDLHIPAEHGGVMLP